MNNYRKITRRLFVALVWGMVAWDGSGAAQTIIVDGSQTNQVIDGFGVNINHRSWNNNELQPVVDQLVDQAGMTIFRVIFDNTDWESVNDNGDPDTMNWSYYNQLYGTARFEKLWDLAAYLNGKGITNGMIFNFQGSGPQWMGGQFLTPGYEDEWAEMITSLLMYARNTRHLQFNLVEPDNEPDYAGGDTGVGANSSSQYGTMLYELALKLNTNGMGDIQFVAPDLGSGDKAEGFSYYFPAMMGIPLVMSKLAHWGMHSYLPVGEGSSLAQQYIQESPYPDINFWMTEYNYWCLGCIEGQMGTYDWNFCSSTAEYLLFDLANGASAGLTWEACDSYYELVPMATNSSYAAPTWSFYGLFAVDNTNGAPKTYTPRKNFYTVSQITKFVPPGSQQIGVNGGSNYSYMVLGFYHAPSGRLTLTGFNNGNAMTLSGTLKSLPPVASLDLYYTDPNTNLCHSATFPVTNGAFTANVPASCIFTLTGFNPASIAVSTAITSPSNGAYFTAPATIPIQATASTTMGVITNVQFLGCASNPGGCGAAPYGTTWSNVAPGNYILTTSAMDSAGNTGVSTGVKITVAGPPAQINIAPPNVTLVSFGSQLFTATVTDAVGTPISPQPAVTWSVSGGGSINTNGLLAVGGVVGGPFVVSAFSGGISNVASVTIASNINLAPLGIGYTWYNLATPTGNAPQYEMPGVNDGNLTANVPLLACCEGAGDNRGAYEAAGVVWSAPQAISSVVYINGTSVNKSSGFFAAGLQLQFTTDGVNWAPAGSQWTVSPAYSYSSTNSSGRSYVFSGSVASVMGVRCIGQVNTGGNSSIIGSVTEVQAIVGTGAGAVSPLTVAGGVNSVTISWINVAATPSLQVATNLISPVQWASVTNAPVQNGSQMSVTMPVTGRRQFYRLVYP